MADNPKAPHPRAAASKKHVEDVELEQDLLDWVDMRAQMQSSSRSEVIAAALRQYRESHRPARKGTSWN